MFIQKLGGNFTKKKYNQKPKTDFKILNSNSNLFKSKTDFFEKVFQKFEKLSLKQLAIETKESPANCSYHINKLIAQGKIVQQKRGFYILKSVVGYDNSILTPTTPTKKRLDNLKFKIPLRKFDADKMLQLQWDSKNTKMNNIIHLYKFIKYRDRDVTIDFILANNHTSCSLMLIIPNLKRRSKDFTSIIEHWDYATNLLIKDLALEFKFNYKITDKIKCSGTDFRVCDGIPKLGKFDHSNVKQDDSEGTGVFEIEGKNLETSEYINSIKDIVEGDVKTKILSMDDLIERICTQNDKFRVFATAIHNQMDMVLNSLNIIAKENKLITTKVFNDENMFG